MKVSVKIIQAHFGEIEDFRLPMIDANRAFAEKNGFQYQMHTRWPDNLVQEYGGDDKTIIADELRFKLAELNDDMIWIDSDCEILKLWKMEKGKPYFVPCYLNGKRSGVDHFLFAVNGGTEWFKQFWDRFRKRKIQWVYGWPRKLTRDQDRLGNIKTISKMCYKHLAVDVKKRTIKRRNHEPKTGSN